MRAVPRRAVLGPFNPPRNLNEVLQPPRAPRISMFSGARHAACGHEENFEAGGYAFNIEIGGSGAPTRRGENFI